MSTQSLHQPGLWVGRARRFLLPVLATIMPLVLLAGAVWMLREISTQREIYLRSQAGLVAASLETIKGEDQVDPFIEYLLDETPGLRSVELVEPEDGEQDAAIVRDIAEGRQLFHSEEAKAGPDLVYRYYTPFHLAGELRVARIELDARAADFLIKPAWTNVFLSIVTGLVLLAVFLYALWIERKAAKLEVERLQMEHLAHLGKMSAVLAHEIRNPLGTIKGFTQLALERAGDATRGFLDTVLEEIRRLERLVQDLLLYGRPLEAKPEPIRWNDLASSLEAFALDAIGDKPVRFESERAELEFHSDPNLLKQALLNLLRNAVEAIPNEGSVRLQARAVNGAVRIEVEDNGPGIPAEVRARLLEPFFTTKAFGTGLGLSICRKVAETLGGRFEIAGRQPRGTIASLILPKELKHGTDSDR